jgi:hypothetical protein
MKEFQEQKEAKKVLVEKNNLATMGMQINRHYGAYFFG